ncbi:MAG: phenylalanine--tRNA ligase subunit alpha [Gemmatimonadetes bacterium]|nr:phenylalanine--tRNA ligase subunit alpha [Gemmatimonadota bacterium]
MSTNWSAYPELAALMAESDRIATLDGPALEAKRIALLGRKQGLLTALFRDLPGRPVDDRRPYGAALNDVKAALESAFERRDAELARAAETQREELDLTMPARRRWVGAEHPVSKVTAEICDIFRGLGFAVATGPEAEDEWLNFFALNFPKDHPALDLHDTMYLAEEPAGPGGRMLLRTHTSPVQIRVMQAGPPPYRVVIPGMVYRNDPFDASHAPGFAQIEGLAVDEGIGLVDLKATLIEFVRRFFGPDTKTRLRPSYFPFTEPSGELDIQCQVCGGSGCPACKGTGWMEILGCGMVHPNVLTNSGVDAERYSGWAFGMGPARVAMNRYGVPDIRLLYGGDMRMLSQLGGGGQ